MTELERLSESDRGATVCVATTVRGLRATGSRGHEISWKEAGCEKRNQEGKRGTRDLRVPIAGRLPAKKNSQSQEGWGKEEVFNKVRFSPNFFIRLRRVLG